MKFKFTCSIKSLIYAIIAFVIITVNITFYLGSGYPFLGDQTLNTMTMTQVYTSFYTWQPLLYSGYMSVPVSMESILVETIQLIAYSLGLMWGYVLSYALLFLVGAIGIFFLVYDLTDGYAKRTRYLGAISASMIFSSQFYALFSTTIPLSTFLPWVFLFWTRLFFEGGGKNSNWRINFSGLAISLILLFASDSGVLPQNIAIISIMAILTLVFSGRNNIKRNLIIIVSVAVIAFLGNAELLYMTYIFTVHAAGSFFSSPLSNPALIAAAINLPQSILSLGSYNIASLLIFLVGLLSLLYIKKSKGRVSLMVLSIFVSFLFVIALITTINAPFGPIFKSLLKAIPYLIVLRYPYSALHYMSLFLASVLFGVGVSYLVHTFAKRGNNAWSKIVVYGIILAILAIYLYVYDYIPTMAHASSTVIPNYVFRAVSYINSRNTTAPIATIPTASNWQFTSWYFGTNIYGSLLNSHPVYTGGYVYYSEIFFPNSQSEYSYLAGAIQNNVLNISTTNVSNMFGIFGIKYVIVQDDALHSASSICSWCYVPPFSLSYIYGNFNASPNMHIVADYRNATVYENTNVVPLVYATNIDNIGNASYSALADAIGNSSLDIHRVSLYDANASMHPAGYPSNAFVHHITGFSPPSISFSTMSPTRTLVKISNASSPFYLVFRESYDTYWKAYYSNGTAIPESDHIMVNGFANAWYVNKPGNYDITLHYSIQGLAWDTMAISIAAFAVALGIGIIGIKEMRSRR